MSAQLNGSALFHIDEGTPWPDAIVILREKATVGREVRVDLLEHAAGSLLGVHLASPGLRPAHRLAALLLVRAGADSDRVKELAEPVRARLVAARAGGIGNPA